MSDDFLKEVNIFQLNLGLFNQFAARLMSQNREWCPEGGQPRDIVTGKDAALIQQTQTELRELAATIAKRHQTELSRSPPSYPSITLHEGNRLMVIACVLGSFGMRFDSTVKTIEEAFRQHARDKKAELDTKKDTLILEKIKELGIAKTRGAAGQLSNAGIKGDVRTIRRRLRNLNLGKLK